MIYGHRHQGGYEIPEWAGQLKHYYWVIRVEGRDRAKRRKYYRYAAKEKLRLAELNIDQDLIKAVCKYLASLKPIHGEKFNSLLLNPAKQISFNLLGD